jgi:hypothetical protein
VQATVKRFGHLGVCSSCEVHYAIRDPRAGEGRAVVLDLIATFSLFSAAHGAVSTVSWVARRRLSKDGATSGSTGLWDVVKASVDGKTQVALERERRLTRIETLNHLNNIPARGSSLNHASGVSSGTCFAVGARGPDQARWSCHGGEDRGERGI